LLIKPTQSRTNNLETKQNHPSINWFKSLPNLFYFFPFSFLNLHGIIEMLWRKMAGAVGDVLDMLCASVYISAKDERNRRVAAAARLHYRPRLVVAPMSGDTHTGPLINNKERSEWFVKDW
jgi:hypothetical protein